MIAQPQPAAGMLKVLFADISVTVRREISGDEAGDRHVPQARLEHQVAVDLVRDDHQVARQLGEALELGAAEHRAARVLRVAEEERFGLGVIACAAHPGRTPIVPRRAPAAPR